VGRSNRIIDGIRSRNRSAEIVVVASAEEAVEVLSKDPSESDVLYYIGHSDCTAKEGNGLYCESEPLNPFTISRARKGVKFAKIVLIGCNSLSNEEYAAAWSRLGNGNVYGTYFNLAINLYAYGIHIPGRSKLEKVTPGRKRAPGGGKKSKKRKWRWSPTPMKAPSSLGGGGGEW
jgi:hypothetical protein